jgi:signal transduction histidine kinase
LDKLTDTVAHIGGPQIAVVAGSPPYATRVRPWLFAAWVAAALALVAASVALSIHSSIVDHPKLFVTARAVAGVGVIVLGLYVFHRHFEQRFASLLLAVGCLFALIGLTALTSPGAFVVGRIASTTGLVAVMYASLAFPRGRLDNRIDSVFIAVAALGSALFLAANLLLSDVHPVAGPFVRCSGSACPSNPLNVVDLALRHSRALSTASGLWTTAMMVGTVILVARRGRDSTLLQQRARVPVLLWTAAAASAYGSYVGVRAVNVDSRLLLPAGAVAAAAIGLLPFAFATGIVRGRVFASTALAKLIGGLGERPSPAEVQTAMARAFGDPPLQLLLWSPSTERYVDVHGFQVAPPRAAARRQVTAFQRNGDSPALVVHDPALADDPSLLGNARAAVLLALENSTLEQDLQQTVNELRASRDRIVSAADRERRRIEQDLHDGAQQGLIAVRIKLGMLEDLAEADPQAVAPGLADVGRNIDAALEQMRELANGIHPSALGDRGLSHALASAIRELPIDAAFDGHGVGRFSAQVETAIYFCCMEAMQNVAKHAGPGAHADVSLTCDARTLSFEVSDDGAGFDQSSWLHSHGLDGLRDRMKSLGGELTITSAPGAGTSVIGRLPV